MAERCFNLHLFLLFESIENQMKNYNESRKKKHVEILPPKKTGNAFWSSVIQRPNTQHCERIAPLVSLWPDVVKVLHVWACQEAQCVDVQDTSGPFNPTFSNWLLISSKMKHV